MQPEDDEAPVRRNVDRIFAAADMLATRHSGDEDQCRVRVPSWFWDNELDDRERKEELLEGQIVVEVDHELHDRAEVLYFEAGDHEARDNAGVELNVPVLEAMRNAIFDAEQSADEP
jgi:hypothetical protein